MSIDVGHLLLAVLSGTAIGSFYFGGLWWTVQRLATAREPALLIGLSFLVRVAVALTAFYFIAAMGWQMLLVSLVCLVGVRVFLVRHWGKVEALPHQGGQI